MIAFWVKSMQFLRFIDDQQLTTIPLIGKLRLSHHTMLHAEVAELVDALASGASGGNPAEVQVLSSAPFYYLSQTLDDHQRRCVYSAFFVFVVHSIDTDQNREYLLYIKDTTLTVY